MLIPKFLFFRLKSLLEILGYSLESIDKYYPKYLISVPRKSRNISLYSPLGGYSISPLSHDFILRFGFLSDYLIDIGANRGNFTDHFFRSTKSNRALLVEPIPNLAKSLRSKYSNNKHGFKIFGPDIMITNDFKPIVLEINQHPGFYVLNNNRKMEKKIFELIDNTVLNPLFGNGIISNQQKSLKDIPVYH